MLQGKKTYLTAGMMAAIAVAEASGAVGLEPDVWATLRAATLSGGLAALQNGLPNKGAQTYIVALCIGLAAIAGALGLITVEMQDAIVYALTGGGYAALRAGGKNPKP